MINKREIIDSATVLSLRPDVVEKDYALGWLLAGISAHPILHESWVFKGGTCLKKCFFETYRFSEDLDFTLRDESHLDENFLKSTFAEISEWVYEECGLELPTDWQAFEIVTNPRGNPSCQGKVSYRGPIAPRSERQLPRMKLDLTADEKLVLAPVRLPIHHPYSDAPSSGIEVQAYAYEEAFGEKVRALGERTRPRDLYDVINLFRNDSSRPASAVLLEVLSQKCEFKGINLPNMAMIVPHRADLEGAWDSMLAHQLPALPPLESFGRCCRISFPGLWAVKRQYLLMLISWRSERRSCVHVRFVSLSPTRSNRSSRLSDLQPQTDFALISTTHQKTARAAFVVLNLTLCGKRPETTSSYISKNQAGTNIELIALTAS